MTDFREVGFTDAAAQYPRDALGRIALAAWCNVPVASLPEGMHYHPNPSTRDAWNRVAEAIAAELNRTNGIEWWREDNAAAWDMCELRRAAQERAIAITKELVEAIAVAFKGQIQAIPSRVSEAVQGAVLEINLLPSTRPDAETVPVVFPGMTDKAVAERIAARQLRAQTGAE